jgi:hypothetical protein
MVNLGSQHKSKGTNLNIHCSRTAKGGGGGFGIF